MKLKVLRNMIRRKIFGLRGTNNSGEENIVMCILHQRLFE
jgi:hypothetical protein